MERVGSGHSLLGTGHCRRRKPDAEEHYWPGGNVASEEPAISVRINFLSIVICALSVHLHVLAVPQVTTRSARRSLEPLGQL